MAKDEKLVSVIPLVVCVKKSAGRVVRHVPGPYAQPFQVTEREAARLFRLRAAKPADPVPEVVLTTADDDDDDDDDQDEQPRPTRAELTARAKELGIDLDEIEGSGKNGALKNVDIEEAIAEELAARAGGRGRSGNPSIVQ